MFVVSCAGCATIPDGRYGVDRLELQGVEHLDAYALRACLATKEREYLSIDLSRDPAPTCGQPPFDARRIHLPLWRWPWTEWPLYDPSVFERDLARIERWYRARGYYGARVLDARSAPPEALYGTRDRCKTRLRCASTSARASLCCLHSVSMDGGEALSERARCRPARSAGRTWRPATASTRPPTTRRGARWCAACATRATPTPRSRARWRSTPRPSSATVHFKINAGPPMELGDVCVEGFGKLPPRLILQASDLRPGHPFSETEIEDARTRIYQMRVLSEVEISVGRVDPKTGANRVRRRTPSVRASGSPGKTARPCRTAPQEPDIQADRVCRLAKKSTVGEPRVPIEIRVKPAPAVPTRRRRRPSDRRRGRAALHQRDRSSGTCTCSRTPRCATSSADCAGCASKSDPS